MKPIENEDPGKLKDVQEDYPASVKGLLSDTCLEYLAELDKAIKLLSDTSADILPDVVAERDGIINALESTKSDIAFFKPDNLVKALTTLKRINANLEARQAAPAAKKYGIIESKPPKNYYSPTSKLLDELTAESEFTGKLRQVIVSGENEKHEIHIFYSLTLTNEAINWIRPFSAFDRCVNAAVISLYVENRRRLQKKDIEITAQQVCRVLTGRTETEECGSKLQEEVTKSIEKQSAIRLNLDISEEVKKRGLHTKGREGLPVKPRLGVNLLSTVGILDDVGGYDVGKYIVTDTPVLYYYSSAVKQITTFDIDMLNIRKVDDKGRITPFSVLQTTSRITIKCYLLNRLAVMRNDKKKPGGKQKQANKILFATLFEKCDIPADDRKARKSAKDFALQCMDYWKAKQYIAGYSVEMYGKAFRSIEVVFS